MKPNSVKIHCTYVPFGTKLHEMYESGLDPTNVFYKDDVDIMLNRNNSDSEFRAKEKP